MADFVAVIRRTVDGLSDNGPEMRAKVYEKARGAVRRQLENMKPRPSDEMIERQMVKLEAAINEVESDHTEALPSLDEQQPEFAPETAHGVPAYAQPESAAVDETPPVTEPEPEESSQQQPVIAEEQREELAEPVEAYVEPAASAEALAAPETVLAESATHETAVDEQPVDGEAVLQAEPAAEAVTIFPEQTETEHTSEPAWQQPEPLGEHESVDARVSDQPFAYDDPDTASAQAVAPADADAPERVEAEPPIAQGEAEEKPPVSEWELPDWSDPVPAAAQDEPGWTQAADAVAINDEVPDLTDYQPVETVTPLNADTESKGQDATEHAHSWAWDDKDPFAQNAAPATEAAESTEPAISDWSWPVEKQAAPEPEAQKLSGDAWQDIEEVLQQGGTAAAAGAVVQQGRGTVTAGAEEELAAPSRPVSYRAEPKRSRINLKFTAVAAALLLAAGGAGYAYWQNQSAVNSWIAATVASITAQVPGEANPGASAPQDGATDTTTPDNSSATQTPPDSDVASLDSTVNKFTQRLQADGTEVNQGPAPASTGEVVAQEGKSVAAQTEAGKPQNAANATPLDQTSDAQPAQAVPAQQTATNPAVQQIPAGAQKMFLYEERLGQSAPTAIEGNVAWSVKEESPGGDAKPEPVIQAQINVPERGLTALMTIKRNVDSSLPASHVVEFVFSLPENFEGGSIESVQRVSMKRNEQDRGDPLIAVPAKITDDFHMIALNDFQEAVATNTELLRGRNWIDIPLTYRNGRRALLTLEKGSAGMEAFTKAMQAWTFATTPNAAAQ